MLNSYTANVSLELIDIYENCADMLICLYAANFSISYSCPVALRAAANAISQASVTNLTVACDYTRVFYIAFHVI